MRKDLTEKERNLILNLSIDNKMNKEEKIQACEVLVNKNILPLLEVLEIIFKVLKDEEINEESKLKLRLAMLDENERLRLKLYYSAYFDKAYDLALEIEEELKKSNKNKRLSREEIDLISKLSMDKEVTLEDRKKIYTTLINGKVLEVDDSLENNILFDKNLTEENKQKLRLAILKKEDKVKLSLHHASSIDKIQDLTYEIKQVIEESFRDNEKDIERKRQN